MEKVIQNIEALDKNQENLDSDTVLKNTRIDEINKKLENDFGISRKTSDEEIKVLEKQRKEEFEKEIGDIEGGGMSLSYETKKEIYRRLVEDKIDNAWEKNEEYDRLKIEKIVLENIGRKDSKLLQRISKFKTDEICEETFNKSLKAILKADSSLSEGERISLFRGALEYFSASDDKIKYPISHATGSYALEGIIKDKKILPAGSGETGEAIGMSRDKQSEISVSEMEHSLSDYVAIVYAKLGASREITREQLKIDADKINNSNIFDELIGVYINHLPEKYLLAWASKKYNLSEEDLKEEIAKEREMGKDGYREEMLKDSKLITDMVQEGLKTVSERSHYRTLDGEEMSFSAFNQLFNSLKDGKFPEILWEGAKISDPEEILKIKHRISVPRNKNEKLLLELQSQYRYYLNGFEDEDGAWHEPIATVSEFKKNKDKYFKEMGDYLKRPDSQYANLLVAKEGDSKEEVEGKMKKLEDLNNQFPSILIINGDEYKENGLLYSQQKGKKPISHFDVEERILSEIKIADIKEIVVPQASVDVVKEWLGDLKDKIKVIPFEYFEIKRVLSKEVDT